MPKQKVRWGMPGRKSIRIALACLAALTAVGAPQTAKQPGQPSAKPQPAQRSPQLGPHAEFLGWDGETALFREETQLQNSKSKTAYYALHSGSRLAAIPQPKTAGSTKLKPGRVLLSDYIPSQGDIAIAFRLDTDDQEVAALGSAIANWSDRGTGKRQSFPIVHATLGITLQREGEGETVLRQRRNLTATAGEGGYVYDPPRLRFAVLSPAGSTLLIELVNGAGSEFIRIPLQRKN